MGTRIKESIYIFDLDWVILDIEDINYSSYKNAIGLSFPGKKFLSFDEYKSLLQWKRFDEIIKTFQQKYQLFLNDREINTIKEKVFIYKKKLLLKTPLFPKIKKWIIQFLNTLKRMKYKIWLATSTIRFFTEIILWKLDIKDMFDIILTSENVKKGKPNPEIYLKAFHGLSEGKSDKYNWIVFEDSISGVFSAFNAWLYCIHIGIPHNKMSNMWDCYYFWGNNFYPFISYLEGWNMWIFSMEKLV